MIANMNYKAIR